MDFILHFFRDVLDGPIYIVVAFISGILICSCIGYLAEQSLLRKKAIEDYKNSHERINQDGDLAWKAKEPIQQSNVVDSISTNTIPIPQNVEDVHAVISGIPTTVDASQSLTANMENNSQNVGQ